MVKKQAEILSFLKRWEAEHEPGFGPSLDEVLAGTGYQSKSSVHAALKRLRAADEVTWRRNEHRTLRLCRPAEPSFAPPPTVMDAVERLLGNIKAEDLEADVALVSAAALGDLDLAYAAAREAA